VDLAEGHKPALFTPIASQPGRPGKPVAADTLQGFAERALDELVGAGEGLKLASNRVAKAVRLGCKGAGDVTGQTIRNWRSRLRESTGQDPAGPGASKEAWKHFVAPLPPGLGDTSRQRGENLLKILERGFYFD
jgi:hypothetical protein